MREPQQRSPLSAARQLVERLEADNVTRPLIDGQRRALLWLSWPSLIDGEHERRTARERHAPSAILHLAAETHVDRSILGAADFVMTNVVGTQTLLDAAFQTRLVATIAAAVERFVAARQAQAGVASGELFKTLAFQ